MRQIAAINDIDDILQCCRQQETASTVVIFDVDNTLFETQGVVDKKNDRFFPGLGGESWFDHYFQSSFSATGGVDMQLVLAKTVILFNALQQHATHRAMEKGTASTFNQLKAMNVPVFALTARSEDTSDATQRALAALGMEFHAEDVFADSTVFAAGGQNIHCINNAVYCSGANKGEVIRTMYRNAVLQDRVASSQHVIFIDDKMKNCERVFDAITELGKTPHVFHYTRILKSEIQYNDELAHEQRDFVNRLYHRIQKQQSEKQDFSPKISSIALA